MQARAPSRIRAGWLAVPLLLLLVMPAVGASAADGAAAPPRAVLVSCPPYVLAAARPADPASPTDPRPAYAIPQVPRPAYLAPLTDPTFGSKLERIAGDAGRPMTSMSGTWGQDARHHYSKTQPWNSDGTLLVIENRDGGSPNPVLLDGNTYEPKGRLCAAYEAWEYRWHPSPSHPHEQINVNRAGTELMWFDVVTCTKTRSWKLPIKVDGMGSGEGNPSWDGRFVALGNHDAMFVVDMDPQPPYEPWPNVRIGPVYSLPPCSLTVEHPDQWTIDNLSISPSGRYVNLKFGEGAGVTDSTEDAARIYEVDPVTLALEPHVMAATSLRCGSFAARPNGWVFPLKHSDLALNPFDDNEDVVIGGRSCPGSNIGRTVMVRMRDGQVTALTDPKNEAPFFHASAQNLDRPGWVYVSYFKADGRRFSDEILAVKMDGSQSVERLCHTHTLPKGCYRCEAHPAPSRDGRRVLFASNWLQDCDDGCGQPKDIKDYVVWDREAGEAPPPR